MHFIASSLMLLLAYVASVGMGDFSHGPEFPLPFPLESLPCELCCIFHSRTTSSVCKGHLNTRVTFVLLDRK